MEIDIHNDSMKNPLFSLLLLLLHHIHKVQMCWRDINLELANIFVFCAEVEFSSLQLCAIKF